MSVPGSNQPSPLNHPASTWEVTYRTLDPVRAAALQAAVSFYATRMVTAENARMVLDVAKVFERYLTGEEADGQG